MFVWWWKKTNKIALKRVQRNNSKLKIIHSFGLFSGKMRTAKILKMLNVPV